MQVTERHRFPLGARAWRVAISPDGATLAVSTYDELISWRLDTGAEWFRTRFTTDYESAQGLAFSPDGDTLAFAGGEEIRLLDPRDGGERSRFTTGLYNGHALFLKGGERLAVGGRCVRVWCVATGRCLATLGEMKNAGGALDVDAAEGLLASVNQKSISLFSLATGDLLKTHTVARFGASGVALSPDGARAWTCEAGKAITLWKLDGKKRKAEAVVDLGAGVWAIARDPQWRWVAAATERGLVLCDPSTGEVLARGPVPRDHVDDMGVSADGTLIATGHVVHEKGGSASGMVRVWRVSE